MTLATPETDLAIARPQAAAGLYLWIEMLVLFVGIPLAFVAGWVSIRWLMPGLILMFMAAMVVLWRDPTFERGRLWRWGGAKREARRVLSVFAFGTVLMAALVLALRVLGDAGVLAVHENVRLFALIRSYWPLWLMIMFGYPLLSVYPQEVLFRAFFFHRYRGILRTPAAMIGVNALVFGWAHAPFVTSIATSVTVALTILGGALFAWTYHRSGSLAAAWMEHALYGCWVFTIGLGWLFYAGSVSAAGELVPSPVPLDTP